MSPLASPGLAPDDRADRQLLMRAVRVLADSARLTGAAGDRDGAFPTIPRSGSADAPDAPDALTLPGAARAVADATQAVLARIPDEDPDDPELRERLSDLVLRSLDVSDALHQRLAAQRTQAHQRLRQGLERLRRVAESSKLLDQVCREVVESCGFDRALLTRIEDDCWLPWMAHFPDDPELEQRITDWMTQQRFGVDQLGHDLLELHPVLVRNASADPREYAPMIEFAKTESFVAAPVTPGGRLIGVLYADRMPSGRPIDELDRDVLWAFAEEFGRMYERASLLERMRAQQARIERAFGSAEALMDALAHSEIELNRRPADAEPEADAGPGGTLAIPTPPPDITALLTTREAEVLALMVRGASNATIAERLIIKEGTVKSHVKHILRKLDAINRSEAISRYIGRA